MRQFDVPEEDRAHYSAGTIDVEYRFGFPGKEWGELMGVANRTDYDLNSHIEASGQKLQYFDQASGTTYVPYVIEPSFGLTRSMMAFLVDAYREEEVPNAKGGTDTRTVLKLDPRLAPVKVAVLPLSRNENLSPLARQVADDLRAQGWNVDFDDAGAIGRPPAARLVHHHGASRPAPWSGAVELCPLVHMVGSLAGNGAS